MTGFRCLPIPSATAKRWRASGQDDRGNVLIRRVADGPGFPCRHCLALARPGEAMLLGSFNLERPQGVYWTPSPIFLHADACPAFAAPNHLAETVRRNPLVSLRCYDAEGLAPRRRSSAAKPAGCAVPSRPGGSARQRPGRRRRAGRSGLASNTPPAAAPG